MAYPPFLSISKTKCLGTGEEEDSPTMECKTCFFFGKFLLKELENNITVFVHVGQPTFRGFCVVFAGPSPPFVQFEGTGNAERELVRRHGHATGKVFFGLECIDVFSKDIEVARLVFPCLTF